MIVDYERLVLRLKERLPNKRSWGTAQLFELIGELEVENEIPEGEEVFDARPPRRHTPASPASAHEKPVHAAAS